MSWWDRIRQAFGAPQPPQPPRSRRPSGRTWRLSWKDGTLVLVAPHGTFPVKRIAEAAQLALAGVPDGSELICEGDYDGGSTISELVVTSATLAPELHSHAKYVEPTPVPAPTLPVPFQRLRDALDALVSVRWCEGTLAPRELAVTVDGETARLDDVQWLIARTEPAPFGRDGETILDENVRSTLRLRDRGAAAIRGLDIAAIVQRVEEAFALECYIDATLLDVLVYERGGKFLRHKDTPRDARQLGTLLVEVPVAHRGGELVLVEGDDEHRVEWGALAAGPRWVAFYGDVDHTVEEVEDGTRVTLAYTLTMTDRPRTDPTLAAHLDAIADATIALLADPAGPGQLIVPCERLAVASDERTHPLERAMLRGNDAAIARTFERCGFEVTVLELLIPSDDDVVPLPPPAFSAYRLHRPIPPSLLASCEALSFEDDADAEEYGPMETVSIQSYVDTIEISDRNWIVRRAAGAKLIYEGLYSQTGYFGNEGGDGFVYVAAALVLEVRD